MAVGYADGRTRTITKRGQISITNTVAARIYGSSSEPGGFTLDAWYCDYAKAWISPWWRVINRSGSSEILEYFPGTQTPKHSRSTLKFTIEYGFTPPAVTVGQPTSYKTGSTNFVQIIDQVTTDDGKIVTTYSLGEFFTFHWTVQGTYEESAPVSGYWYTGGTGVAFAEYRRLGQIKADVGDWHYTTPISVAVTADANSPDLYKAMPTYLVDGTVAATSTNKYMGFATDFRRDLEKRLGEVSQGAHAIWTALHSGDGIANPSLPSRSANGCTVGWCELTTGPAPKGSDTTIPGTLRAEGTWGGSPKQQVTVIGKLYDLLGSPYADAADLQFVAQSGQPSQNGVSSDLVRQITTSGGTAQTTFSCFGCSQISRCYREVNNTADPVGGTLFVDTEIEDVMAPPNTNSLPVGRLNGNFYVGFRQSESPSFLTLEPLKAHYEPSRWKALTLSQAPSSTMFAAPWQVSNYTPSGVTLTATATALRIQAASTGTPQLTVKSGISTTGYRYLTFRVRSVGSAKRTITLAGSKNYEITTGADGEWTDCTIDLLVPKVSGARPPVSWETNPPIALPGVWKFPAGSVIEIESVKGVRKYGSWVTVRALAHPDALGDDDGATQLIFGYTDGILSLREYTIYQPTETARKQSLTKIAASINANTAKTGWSATLYGSTTLPPAAADYPPVSMSYYQNGNAPAAFLEGEGLIGGVVCRDKAAPIDLRHEAIANSMAIYPGCGDVQGAGGYGSSTSFEFRGLIGSEVAGVVLDPGDDTTVEMRLVSPDQLRGTGTPDGIDGWYATGTPFGRGGSNIAPARPGNVDTQHKAILKSGAGTTGTPPSLPATTRQRVRNHIQFSGPGKKSGRNVDGITHPALEWYGRANVLSDGKTLQFQRTDGSYRTSGSMRPAAGILTAQDGETISSPSLVIDKARMPERLICQYEKRSGGVSSIYETYSFDDGDTWETPTVATTNGKTPVIARTMHGGTGTILRTWFADGTAGDGTGQLSATKQEPGDQQPGDAFGFEKDDGTPLIVKSTGHHVTQGQNGQATWLLSCTLPGEDQLSDWWSADEGKTWTRFTTES